MKSYILTVLEILLLQYAWAGPFACVKCPIDDVNNLLLIYQLY